MAEQGTNEPGVQGAAGAGAAGQTGSDPAGVAGTDAAAVNKGPAAGAETPKEAAKDPALDPAVAGTKLFAGQNRPAAAVDPRAGGPDRQVRSASEVTPHKITGHDVTQPPALDLDSGLSRTTQFEKVQDDKEV